MKIIFLLLSILILGVLYVLLRQVDRSYDGFYLTEGYDLLFDISNGKVVTYQVSDDKLIPFKALDGNFKAGVIKTDIIELTLKKEKSKIIATNSLGLEILKMKSIPSLDKYKITEGNNPIENYEIFWQSFEDNYPYFDLYKVDWHKQKEKYRNLVTKDTTTKELFDIFKMMATDLNDAHIYITYNDNEFSPYKDLPLWNKENNSRKLVQVIEENYIKDLQYSKDRMIRHGHLDDKIGYILIASFGGYLLESESINKISKAFKSALEDLKDTKRLVIDLRFNQGGYDSTGLAIANSLITQDKLAYKTQIKYKEVYTELLEVYLNVDEDVTYKNDIILLTSGATVSAAETFILSIKDLENVSIIGEETAGFYSDRLERVLPNGISFGLAHMKYYSVDNELMESQKHQPSVYLPIDLKLMKKNIDPALIWLLDN